MSNVTSMTQPNLLQDPDLDNEDPFIRSVIPLISPMASPAQQQNLSDEISLDATIAEFKQWRNSKSHPGAAIPDALWKKLFHLANVHSAVTIRSLFNISTKQYQKKWEEFHSTSKKESPPTEALNSNKTKSQVEICEIKLKPSSYEAEPLPYPKTMVIEFYRTDGQRMSIHITQDSITEVLQAFFKG